MAREEEERQRQKELDRVRELASYSLVDERFRESTFDNFVASTPEDERVQRICRNYVEHFDEMLANNAGLLFFGSPGTGKTFAASCIANALMERRVPVLVTSIVRLTANMFGDDLNELLERMNTARLLVLDDFGRVQGRADLHRDRFAVRCQEAHDHHDEPDRFQVRDRCPAKAGV